MARCEFRGLQVPAVIPFQPRSSEALAARAELRAILKDLVAQPGQLLHGLIEGPGVDRTDLDNALLYNIGGRIAGGSRYGVLLERRLSAGAGPVRYRYGLVEAKAAPTHKGESVAVFESELAGMPRRWWEVWSAVRNSGRTQTHAAAASEELGLEIRLGAPGLRGGLSADLVKGLIDGVLVALHSETDRVSVLEPARRLAQLIKMEPEEVAALLLDQHDAALGSQGGLIALRASGVQCHPQDERLARLRIDVDRDVTSWRIRGRVTMALG